MLLKEIDCLVRLWTLPYPKMSRDYDITDDGRFTCTMRGRLMIGIVCNELDDFIHHMFDLEFTQLLPALVGLDAAQHRDILDAVEIMKASILVEYSIRFAPCKVLLLKLLYRQLGHYQGSLACGGLPMFVPTLRRAWLSLSLDRNHTQSEQIARRKYICYSKSHVFFRSP